MALVHRDLPNLTPCCQPGLHWLPRQEDVQAQVELCPRGECRTNDGAAESDMRSNHTTASHKLGTEAEPCHVMMLMYDQK